MPEELKYLDKTEACYETEYALRKDIHYRKGEILKLEHINAKHCREIESLNARISTILETTPDVSGENLFEYVRALIVETLQKDKNRRMYPKPSDIDLDYVKSALKYIIPGLFNKYALLDQDDSIRDKVQLADDILSKFGITEMYEYINLQTCDKIGIAFIDNRDDMAQKDHRSLLSKDEKHKIELADSILNKFGIETMAKYEELIQRGDIDIDILDHRSPHLPKGL